MSAKYTHWMRIMETLNAILTAVISGGSLVFSVWVYATQKKDEKIRDLAKQVIAYYQEEQIAVSKIASLTNKSPQTVQRELRTETENTSDCIRPSMTATKAKSYL